MWLTSFDLSATYTLFSVVGNEMPWKPLKAFPSPSELGQEMTKL